MMIKRIGSGKNVGVIQSTFIQKRIYFSKCTSDSPHHLSFLSPLAPPTTSLFRYLPHPTPSLFHSFQVRAPKFMQCFFACFAALSTVLFRYPAHILPPSFRAFPFGLLI